jgi:hypothetical protein
VVISPAFSLRYWANLALGDIIGIDQRDRLDRRLSNTNLDGRNNVSGLARSQTSVDAF